MINNINAGNNKKQKLGTPGKKPGLSSTATMVLLVGAFLIIIIPLLLINGQQPAKQSEIQQQILILQKVPTSTAGGVKQTLEAQVKQADTELQTIVATLPKADQSPDVLNKLVDLALTNGITVTKTEIKIEPIQVNLNTKEKTSYPAISYTLGLRGQISKFQNFLLALEKFPSSRVRELTLTPAEKKGDEDQATIKLDIFIYQGQQ